MLEEFLRFVLYGMPGWVSMTIALIGCLPDDDQENKLLDSAEDE